MITKNIFIEFNTQSLVYKFSIFVPLYQTDDSLVSNRYISNKQTNKINKYSIFHVYAETLDTPLRN